MNKNRILLIGYMPPPIGGATVSFRQLTRELSSPSIPARVKVIDLSRKNNHVFTKIKTHILGIVKVLKNITGTDVVSYHASEGSFFAIGPLLFLLSKFFGKPFIIRAFGGALHKRYESSARFQKMVLNHTVGRADLVLLQTHQLVSYFRGKWLGEIKWFPNSRPISREKRRSHSAEKFVFVGQIKKGKGIAQLCQASDAFPEGVTAHIYGPTGYDISRKELKRLTKRNNVEYKGEIDPDEVRKMLLDYDMLILPTRYEKEGYPGVILEAFSAGLPVIATVIGAIPELLDDSAGILMQKASNEEIGELVTRVYKDRQLFDALQKGASGKTPLFDSSKWAILFWRWCDGMASGEKLKKGP